MLLDLLREANSVRHRQAAPEPSKRAGLLRFVRLKACYSALLSEALLVFSCSFRFSCVFVDPMTTLYRIFKLCQELFQLSGQILSARIVVNQQHP